MFQRVILQRNMYLKAIVSINYNFIGIRIKIINKEYVRKILWKIYTGKSLIRKKKRQGNYCFPPITPQVRRIEDIQGDGPNHRVIPKKFIMAPDIDNYHFCQNCD